MSACPTAPPLVASCCPTAPPRSLRPPKQKHGVFTMLLLPTRPPHPAPSKLDPSPLDGIKRVNACICDLNRKCTLALSFGGRSACFGYRLKASRVARLGPACLGIQADLGWRTLVGAEYTLDWVDGDTQKRRQPAANLRAPEADAAAAANSEATPSSAEAMREPEREPDDTKVEPEIKSGLEGGEEAAPSGQTTGGASGEASWAALSHVENASTFVFL